MDLVRCNLAIDAEGALALLAERCELSAATVPTKTFAVVSYGCNAVAARASVSAAVCFACSVGTS